MNHIYNVPPVVNKESRFKEILKNLLEKSEKEIAALLSKTLQNVLNCAKNYVLA